MSRSSPGSHGQIRLLTDWLLDAVLPRDINQLRLFHQQPVHREHFEPGERVFGTGDVGDKVYFVVRGDATVERDGAAIAKLKTGDVFGEAALIAHQPRNATVRAATALDTVVVARPAFQELLGHLPGMSATMEELMEARLGRAVALGPEMSAAAASKHGAARNGKTPH